MNIKQQLRRLNLFGFSACLRIPDAVWVVLLVARGFSLWQIGIAECLFHMVSLLAEVPSGMAADLLGRRRTLTMAGLCGIASALLMACSTRFFGVCLSMVFSALACNFISGSDEALLYDSLLQSGRENDYLAVNARYTQIQTLGSMLSNIASLLTGFLSFVGLYLLDAAVCCIRVLSAWSLTEPTVTEAQALRRDHPFRALGSRFRTHVKEVGLFLQTHPRTAMVMLADGLLTLPSFLTLMFLQQRLHELGLAAMWLGLPILCISLSRMVGVSIGKRLRPMALRTLYIFCTLLVGAGTIIAGAAPLLPAVLGAMAAACCMDIWILHLQNHLNQLFPSDRRATLVSVNMMAYSLLMIFASPIVGWLGDYTGTAGTGLCALGAVIAAAGILTVFLKKTSK